MRLSRYPYRPFRVDRSASDEVSGRVPVHDGRPDAQVVCAGGSAEQELVRVQLFWSISLSTHFLHRRRDVLGVPALDGVVAVSGSVLIF